MSSCLLCRISSQQSSSRKVWRQARPGKEALRVAARRIAASVEQVQHILPIAKVHFQRFCQTHKLTRARCSIYLCEKALSFRCR